MKDIKSPESRRTAKFTVYLYPRNRVAKENNKHNSVVICANSKEKVQFKSIGKLADFLLAEQVKLERGKEGSGLAIRHLQNHRNNEDQISIK